MRKRYVSSDATSNGHSTLANMKDSQMPVFGAPRKVNRRDDKISSFAMEVLGDFPQGKPPTSSDLGAIFTHTPAKKSSATEAFSVGEPTSRGSFANHTNGSVDAMRGTEVASNGHGRKKGEKPSSSKSSASSGSGSKASASAPSAAVGKSTADSVAHSASNSSLIDKRRRVSAADKHSSKLFSVQQLAGKELPRPPKDQGQARKPKVIIGRGAGKNMSLYDRPIDSPEV
eukprot:scpid13606/ scgid1417/ 